MVIQENKQAYDNMPTYSAQKGSIRKSKRSASCTDFYSIDGYKAPKIDNSYHIKHGVRLGNQMKNDSNKHSYIN